MERKWLLYYCFGHPSFDVLKTMFPHSLGVDVHNALCETCQFGEHKKANFGNVNERSTLLLYRIHSNVRGPVPTQSLLRAWFVDDSRVFTWLNNNQW